MESHDLAITNTAVFYYHWSSSESTKMGFVPLMKIIHRASHYFLRENVPFQGDTLIPAIITSVNFPPLSAVLLVCSSQELAVALACRGSKFNNMYTQMDVYLDYLGG